MSEVITITNDPANATSPAAPSAFDLAVFETRLVPLRELHESPKNPRRFYAGLTELAESIGKEGLRVAIVARPRLEGGGYEIAAGHRRYRASKLAGVEAVPVQVRDLTDAQLIDWLAFENDHRSDLNEIERAQGWQLWMDESAATVADLIEKTGLKQAYVYKTLKLLEAIPEAQEAYVYGKIKVGHLEHIARIPSKKEQRLALRACEPAEFDPERQLTTRELKTWIAKNLHTRLHDAPFSVADASLVPGMGSCELCPHRLGNAPDFDANEDLADMCTRRECFDWKVKEHVNQVIATRGESLVLVSEIGGAKPDGILPKGDWHETGRLDGQGKDALVVEGPRIGREIRVVVQERIAPAPQAPEPAREALPGFEPKPGTRKKTPAEIEQARKDQEARDLQSREEHDRQEKERQDREARLRREADARLKILTATLKEVKWPPKREDVARVLSHTVGEDVIAGLPEKLDEALVSIFGVKDYRFVDLAALPGDQIARLLVLMTVVDDLDDWAMNHGCDVLHATAKRYGVDVEAIRNQAKEAEGGTRKQVIKKLPTVGQSAKKAAPRKKAGVQHLTTLLKPRPAVKKAAPKASGKKKAGKGKK